MIKTVTPARAAEILREHGMRTSAETLKYGLVQNKVFKDVKHGDI